MKDNKTLTTLSLLDFAELLEDMGLLALGEPFVRTNIFKGIENIDLYLTYPQHGVHCILASTSLVSSSSQIRSALFNLQSDSEEENSPDLLLSDFIQENSHRHVLPLKLEEINKAASFVGSESQKKRLTWLLAHRILNKDIENTISDSQLKEQRLSAIIRSTTDAIGRPEQVAYLSRFDDLTLEDVKTFINLPIEWLSRSFSPSNSHTMITLPHLENSNMYPLDRSALFLK